MKSTFVLPLTFAIAAAFLPACDKVEDAKAAGSNIADAVGNLDADTIKNKVGDLTAQLDNIKDLASAEAISKKVGPLLDTITKGKDLLAGNVDMASITEAITSLKTRFAGKADILKALEPLIEKLSALVK